MTCRRIALVAALGFTASCGDDDPLNLNGSVSFNHSGSVTGTFSAIGRLPLIPDISAAAWAAGTRDDQNQAVFITAIVPRSGNRYDNVVVVSPRLTPGSNNVAPILNCAGVSTCAFVTVNFGVSQADDTDFTLSCFLETGSVVLSSISQNRAAGSFSGTGECTTPTGTVTVFTITNGSFDVPLLQDVPGVT